MFERFKKVVKEFILDKTIENLLIKLFKAIVNHFLKKYDFGTHDEAVQFLMKR